MSHFVVVLLLIISGISREKKFKGFFLLPKKNSKFLYLWQIFSFKNYFLLLILAYFRVCSTLYKKKIHPESEIQKKEGNNFFSVKSQCVFKTHTQNKRDMVLVL